MEKIEYNESVQQISKNEMEEMEGMEEIIEDLIYYVRTNDIEEVKSILENEKIYTINIKDENNNTLLHYACANNNVDMILFLLYECSINYNQLNNNGNTPLLWAIQNKHYEAVKEILFFDYFLNKNEYLSIEKKKNDLYENMRDIKNDFLKENYKLTSYIKKKIQSIDIYNVFDITEKSEVERINLYKQKNKIDLLKKNFYNKNILSEAFNIENENILHLILSHPMSSVLDNQENSYPNENAKIIFHDNENNNIENFKDKNVCNLNECLNNELAENNKNTDNINSGNNNYINVNINNDSNIETVEEKTHTLNNSFTTNLEEAKIVQECVYELLINENIKLNNNNIIIKIREIGLNYYGDSLDDKTSQNDITGINIWESCLIFSKWICDLCLENNFSNKNVLEIGAGSGLASISLFVYSNVVNKNNGLNNLVISDINLFTLNNISYNINLNKELLDIVDLKWKDKITVCNVDLKNKNTYIKENNEIITYDCIIGSDLIYSQDMVEPLIYFLNMTLKKNGNFFYVCKKNRDGIHSFLEELKNNNFNLQFYPIPKHYFNNCFINLDKNLFETKFSELDQTFIMIKCEKL
ncbi:methyltransferase, putative [Plasmodium gallinaceum]|uniref:Methyltransferase, putative n=1 Tax=Plasmodium gallinaceum TaxID=5849 RepID=A0A1J1GVG6_PLAGA|nr:methyltransferase, putative [Plasmodium gallinaceum]CRG96477.1 methyltransferase, putative [Plasmodium gallinaceum]